MKAFFDFAFFIRSFFFLFELHIKNDNENEIQRISFFFLWWPYILCHQSSGRWMNEWMNDFIIRQPTVQIERGKKMCKKKEEENLSETSKQQTNFIFKASHSFAIAHAQTSITLLFWVKRFFFYTKWKMENEIIDKNWLK